MLGSVFKGLTAITEALIPLAKNLKPVIGALREIVTTFGDWYEKLNDVTGGNNILIGVLLLTAGKGAGLAKIIERVVFAFRNGARFSGVFAYVMRTVMGNALLRTISRFGIWAVAIWGVSKALSFVFNQMERSKAGQWTFFDEVSHSIRMMMLNLELADAKYIYFQAKVRAGILDFTHGVINTVRDIDFNIKKPPTPQGTPITPYKVPSLVNNAMNIRNPSGIPYRNTTTVPAVVNIGQVVVDKNGMAVASKATTTIPNMISP